MSELTRWLQNNPVVVLGMFLVSLASGVAGLLLGWKQLYEDYLSRSIEIPVWLLMLIVLLLPGFVALYRHLFASRRTGELQKVEGKKFGVQRIVVDGKAFERCEFHGSEIIFKGADVFAFTHCKFERPTFSFNESAGNTIHAMTVMHGDPAFRPLIIGIIDGIQKGEHPKSVPPAVLG